MFLTREHIQAFIKAYEQDVGETLTSQEAFEMLDRLLNIFMLLEKAEHLQELREREELNKEDSQEQGEFEFA